MSAFWITWMVGVVALALFAGWLGSTIRGSVWGIFIDRRNTWSLSQFQLSAWTLAGLPLIIATAVWRARSDAVGAWDFKIPGELLALMGISIGSAVTSLVIKSAKDTQRGDGIAARELSVKNPPIQDMFAVEEGSTALKSIDITKVQNFVVTISLLVTYMWIAFQAAGDVATGQTPQSLPAFSQTMVGLLALSHGGYLVGKIPNRSGVPGATEPPLAAPTVAPGQPAPPTASGIPAPPTRLKIVTVSSLD